MSKLEELIKEFCPNGVEYKPLEECCSILDNKRKPVTKSVREYGEYPYYGANGIQDYVSDYIFDGVFVLVGEDGSVLTSNGTPVVNWAEGKIWVNNHAHIIAEKEGILLRYLYHYLQTISIVSLVHGNIPKLTGSDFKSLQIPLPALPVQREIVRILDSFTLYSAELTAELTARRKQYEFYRDKLLNFTCNIIQTNIGQVCNVFTGGEPPVEHIKGDVPTVEYKYPIWGNGKDIYGYSKTFQIGQDAVVISSIGANTGAVYFRKANFTPIIRLKVLTPKNNDVNIRYLFYYLSNKKIESKSSSVPNMNSKEIKQLSIEIPPMQVQEKIVKVLDNFDAICSDLGIGLPAEIEKRQKQYEYYREKLLTFDGKYATILTERNGTERAGLIRLLQYVYGFAFVRLGDICSISSGRNTERLDDGEYPVYGSTGIIAKTNIYKFDCEQILIARVGANAGYVYKAYGKYDVSDNTLILSVNSQYNANFIFYNLINMRLNRFAKGGGQPLITAGQIKELLISLPTLDKQKEIVAILDKFDSLCNDLSAGLPAEIEYRQKQYEYYRDKLLTF